MSRTLLSNRLKEFISIGIVDKQHKRGSNQVEYKLTKAGLELGNVVFSMAQWGQEWLKVEPSTENIDTNYLMWDIRRNVKPMPELPDPFVVQFNLTDVSQNKKYAWLVFENEDVDLCYVDHDFEVDVQIEATAQKLTKVWMGWEDYSTSISDGSLKLKGPQQYTKLAEIWLGKSSVAHIKKRPVEEQVNR